MSLDGPATAVAIRSCGYTGRIIGMCGSTGGVCGESRIDFHVRPSALFIPTIKLTTCPAAPYPDWSMLIFLCRNGM